MSSISGAKSGSSIWLACCIARDVRPILRPLIGAAVGQLERDPRALDRVAVVDGHYRESAARSGAAATARSCARCVELASRARRWCLVRQHATQPLSYSGCRLLSLASKTSARRRRSAGSRRPVGAAWIGSKKALATAISASPMRCCVASLRPLAHAQVEVGEGAVVVLAVGDRVVACEGYASTRVPPGGKTACTGVVDAGPASCRRGSRHSATHVGLGVEVVGVEDDEVRHEDSWLRFTPSVA